MDNQKLPWDKPQVAMVVSILEGKVVKVDTVKVVNVRVDDGK